MSSSLIDLNTVAAIKAGQKAPLSTPGISLRRAQTITPREMVGAFVKASEFLDKIVAEARQKTNGHEIAAYLVYNAVDLHAFAAERFAGVYPDPRGDIRRKAAEIFDIIWNGIKETIAEGLHEAEPKIREEIRAELQVDNLIHAADVAQAESTAARRERDALAAQVRELESRLGKLRYDHEKANRKVQAELAELSTLRALAADAEKRANWLHAEKKALISKVVELTQQGKAYVARIAELEIQVLELQTRPVEVAMPKITRTPLPPSLAALSFVAFLRANGQQAFVEEGFVRHQLGPAEHDRLNVAWREAIPDVATAMAQLRAVVLPILRKAA